MIFLKKIHGICFYFCIFGTSFTYAISFTYKYNITFLSKKNKQTKKHLLPKNALKDGNSGITEKVDVHPRKYGISSDRKIKDGKKVYSVIHA